jgi:hypothetical protein
MQDVELLKYSDINANTRPKEYSKFYYNGFLLAFQSSKVLINVPWARDLVKEVKNQFSFFSDLYRRGVDGENRGTSLWERDKLRYQVLLHRRCLPFFN